MDGNDRQAIATLFDRLAEAERQSPPRDPEAEAFIRESMSQQPGAPYYMAQTVIVQQQALEAAQARIAELEARTSNSGGIFGALFGGGVQPAASRPAAASAQRGRQPWAGHGAQQGGTSFLGGAAQTAMGVAGGVLLGNMLAGALFGGNEAQAAEPPPEEDAGGDDFGDFDGGGDFGDF